MSSTNLHQDNPLSLVWLRRDLRLHDHGALAEALTEKGTVQPIFVFDSEILKRFSSIKDRRLTFIADALWKIHCDLAKMNSGLLVVHGRAQEIVPKLSADRSIYWL